MVLLPSQEAAVVRRISLQRNEHRELQRPWLRPASAQPAPIGEWQEAAAALSASTLALSREEDALRRSQIRLWHHDELESVRENRRQREESLRLLVREGACHPAY